MIDVPQIAFPFRLNTQGTDAVVNEQGDDDDIMDQVEVLMSTEVGERIELPEYGIEDQTFKEGGADRSHIIGQISTYVPNADIDLDDEEGIVDLVDHVRLRIQGRSE